MSDHHLRALARRAAASGSADDEAAWLLARLRAGDLPLPRLRLTAYLGDPAARLVLGDPGRPAPRTGAEARRWAKGLGGFGREACARGAAALARACLPALAGAPPPLRPGPVSALVGAIEGALAARTRPALREVAAARARAERDPAWSRAHEVAGAVTRARLVALEAATALCAPTAQRAAEAVGQAAAWAAAEHDVAAVVASDLLPWARRADSARHSS